MADDNNIMSFLQGASMRNNYDCNGGWNGFGLLIILLFLMLGGGNWGNRFGDNGMAAAALMGNANNSRNDNTQFSTLMAGQDQIRNQMGYDNMLNGIRGLERGMCDSTYALNNSITTGFAGTQNTLCQGFSGVNSAISNLGFNLAEKMNNIASNNNLQLQGIQNTIQSCCCDMKSTIAANTQKILDKMCCNVTQALRDELFKKSQELQTVSIVSQLKTTTAA